MNRTALALLVFAAITCGSALATPPAANTSALDLAIADYKAKHFAVALSKFREIVGKSPTNDSARYYMALCYQGMNQMSLARQQYEWVASNGREPLRSYAQSGLTQISKFPNSYSSASSSVSSVAGTPSLTSAARASSPTRTAALAPKISGKLKVLEFSTTWCGYCKKFAPDWDDVSNTYRQKADFQTLDGDDAANEVLKTKYGITGYPTIIFTDNTGKMLDQMSGAPTRDDFENKIKSFLGVK